LNSIVGFAHFRATREGERIKKATDELTDLTTKMQALSNFIQTYIPSNITSDLIEPLMKLNGELTAALVVPQKDNLTRVLPDAEFRVTELGLATDYEEFKKTHSRGSLTLLPTTSKNRYLVQGPEDEILFLVNDTGRAHVVRDLRGQLVFEDNKATVCFPHSLDLDRFSLLQVRLEIIAKGAHEVSFAATPCPMDFLAVSDIVVVARRLLVRSSKETAKALLEAIDKDELAQIGVFTEREIKDRRDSESLKSLEIEDGIEGSTRFGFGIVATDNSSSIICQAANDDHPKAHDALINRWRDRLEYEFQSRPVVAVTSIESGFIRIKRGECRAVYAIAESLKELIEAFKRDNKLHPQLSAPVNSTSGA
jgi:hypothetical protein